MTARRKVVMQHAARVPEIARRRLLTPLSLGLLATAALSGCASSPDSHYYTLADNGGAMQSSAEPATVPGNRNSSTPLLIEVLPVNVPGQVARPQMVLTDGDGKISIEDFNRWSSSLDTEIGGALSQSLSRRLGAIDTYRAPHAANATVYRITLNVKKFESMPGQRATIDAVWSVVRSGDALTLTCQTHASAPVSAGFAQLAAGHRKALAQISADIAAGVRSEMAVPVSQPDIKGKPSDKGTGPYITCPAG